MKLGCFITITNPIKRGDLYNECIEMANNLFDEVTIVDGKDTWPKEFSWELIGQHFQKGYEQCEADFIVHLDTDYIFHERDFRAIRMACENNKDAPALSFWKYQFILPDRYNLKSRLVLAVNKGKYGDRIRFDSGGDLCQPSLDGEYINPDSIPEARIPFYNYEKIIKTEAQVRDDVERMARAWHRYFGNWHLGTTKTAYSEWLNMQVGRFKKPQEFVALDNHPKIMQDVIKELTPEQWGYSGFGHLGVNQYAKNLRSSR